MSVQPEQLTRCRAVPTSSWSDALDRLGLPGVCQGLTLRSGHGSIAGTAVTVKERVGVRGTYDPKDFAVGAMLDSVSPGSVLIVEMGGAPVSTFGGLAAHAAVQRGVSGLIVDGGCRDIEEIRAAGLWVSSRHVTPTSGRSRVLIEGINVPITVCGITINPGDYIIGDETGIAAVPPDRVVEALAVAEELTAQDVRFSAALDRGETFGAAASRLQHM